MRIRLLTYNVHKCIGGIDRRYAPERVRDVVAPHAPDFVFLQEVDEFAERSRLHRQVDVLGDLLGYRHRTYFPNVLLRGGGHYGNGILSRFPITHTRNIDVTVPLTKRRSVLHARVRVRRHVARGHAKTVHLFNLHLGLSAWLRRRQLLKFLSHELVARADLRTPFVLAGDFNDVWGNLGPKLLVPAGWRGMPKRLRTFPSWAPVEALDGVFTRGEAEVVAADRGRLGPVRWASDHLPIVAEIKVK